MAYTELEFTNEECLLRDQAVTFIRHGAGAVRKKYADPLIYKPASKPVSLFMAGSPGAGKTEVSKGLIRRFDMAPVRIDADEIRADCPGYVGTNAYVFQKAATKGVHILVDHCLDKGINFILDGTFAYAGAADNIRRSLTRDRSVEIWFVYQDPLRAWEFTKIRERIESRRVPKEVFIDAFFNAVQNVKEAKDVFGNTIELNLLIKDYSEPREEVRLNITSDELDRYIASGYSKNELHSLLHD